MENKKSQPVLLAQSAVAALAFVFGGFTTMGASTNNPTLALIGGIGTLVAGGISIGLGFYVRGVVVPLEDTAAYVNTSGETVAGPAAGQSNGTPVVTVDAAST